MSTLCPKGHQSDDADYCSECGARIGGASLVQPTPSTVAGVAPAGGNGCPDCGTPRSGGARFCEVCRHDFQTGTSTRPDVIIPANVISAPIPAPQSVDVPSPAPASVLADAPVLVPKLSVVVKVDPSLVTEPDPDSPCPTNAPERVFPLDLAENLVGRRSESKDSHPEIPLNDPGASRRHMKFLRQQDGSFQIVDLGSANGVMFNGVLLEAGVQTPVAPGDEITLGMWTRMIIRAR